MAEQLILTTLRTKRASIERRIKAIEESLEQARHEGSRSRRAIQEWPLHGRLPPVRSAGIAPDPPRRPGEGPGRPQHPRACCLSDQIAGHMRKRERSDDPSS